MSDAPVAAKLDAPESTRQRFLNDVERHMRSLVAARDGAVSDAVLGPIAAGGKGMRPLLVLAAHPRGLDADPTADAAFRAAAIRAGAAVELVHTASLVHDDLLDGANLRRGVPTIGATSGRAIAIAGGDLLFALAFATLTECRTLIGDERTRAAVRVLADAARTLAEGEELQARQERDVSISTADYIDRCERKTGVLFAAALQIGGILGGIEQHHVALLGSIGRTVGTAFQLADDILDCGAPDTERVLGKRPGADVRDGTITLPMLQALAVDPGLGPILAAPIADDAVEPVLARIRATGALEQARAQARELEERALAMLDELDELIDTEPLRAVARTAVHRSH